MKSSLILLILLCGCSLLDIDFHTPLGIPVAVEDHINASKEEISTYIDTVFTETKKEFPGYKLHRLPVELHRHLRDGVYSGTYFTCSFCLFGDEYIWLRWKENNGAQSYAHELFHQLGFNHDKFGNWNQRYLNQLQFKLHAKGYQATYEP